VSHIGFSGPVVRIELERDDKSHVDVEVSAPAFHDLDLRRGETVWFAPRVQHDFALDYVI
jgi:hypothetical protein